MFLGTHTPKLDEKGRVILPAKFRDELTDGLVMTKGQERCIVIWTSSAFNDYAAWDHYLALQEPGFASLDEEILP